MRGGWRGNRGPDGKQWQPIAEFMASVTCGLTAEDRDQLQNPTLVSSMDCQYRGFTVRYWFMTIKVAKHRINDCI